MKKNIIAAFTLLILSISALSPDTTMGAEEQKDASVSSTIETLLSMSRKIEEDKDYDLNKVSQTLIKMYEKPEIVNNYFKLSMDNGSYATIEMFAKRMRKNSIKAAQANDWKRSQKLLLLSLQAVILPLHLNPTEEIKMGVEDGGNVVAPPAYLLSLKLEPAFVATVIGINNALDEIFIASNKNEDIEEIRKSYKLYRKEFIKIAKDEIEFRKKYLYAHKGDKNATYALLLLPEVYNWKVNKQKIAFEGLTNLMKQIEVSFESLIVNQDQKDLKNQDTQE